MSSTTKKTKRKGQREKEKNKQKNKKWRGRGGSNDRELVEEVGKEEGRTVSVESWKEGEVRKLVTVARKVTTKEEETV